MQSNVLLRLCAQPYSGFNKGGSLRRQRESQRLERANSSAARSRRCLAYVCLQNVRVGKNAEKRRRTKDFDVVALGNLCVDIVVNVEELPSLEEVKTPEMLQQLTESSATGATENWEAGAQSNFMIAAARLGLRVASAANLGQDVYGKFLSNILQEEGVQSIEPLAPRSFEEQLRQTLLCFVLVDPSGKHHFCSRYDFGPWPLLPGVDSVPEGVKTMLESTEALFINGFIFDELPGQVVLSAVQAARNSGASIFFDPGPRAWTLRQGTRRKALDALLDLTDVVLMTQDEAQAVTGCSHPEEAAVTILERPEALTQWCVIKMGPKGALVRTKHPPQTLLHPAIQVPVADTVGCGDSFAAAVVLGYIQRRPLSPILALSNAVGAATATSTGAGRNVASADVIRRILNQQASGHMLNGVDSMDYDEWVSKLAAEEGGRSQQSKARAIDPTQDQAIRFQSSQRTENGCAEAAFEALRLLDESLTGSRQSRGTSQSM